MIKNSVPTIGIIGLGSFGSFVASLCPGDYSVIGYDEITEIAPKNVMLVSLEQVAQADIIILGVPLHSYEGLLSLLSKMIPQSSLIVDVCSVKSLPEKYLDTYFPSHPNILITHPLFGPQSAAVSTKGHRLIVTRSSGKKAQSVIDYCENKLELDVVQMTAEKHDKIMAQVHALTFFVARGLRNLNLSDEVFMTPSYRKILDLIELDALHSQALFSTVEQGNPYAKPMYEQVIRTMQELAEEIADNPYSKHL